MLIALPAHWPLFQHIAWTPMIPQQRNRSEFTSRTQTIGLPGAEEWRATAYPVPATNVWEERAWRAFFTSCRGSENTFNLPALAWPQTGAPDPLVTAAVAGNRAITVADATYIGVGMYGTVLQTDGHARLVTVVGIDGLDVHFEPYLSADPTIGANFIIGDPYSRVELIRPDNPIPNLFEWFKFEVAEKL